MYAHLYLLCSNPSFSFLRLKLPSGHRCETGVMGGSPMSFPSISYPGCCLWFFLYWIICLVFVMVTGMFGRYFLLLFFFLSFVAIYNIFRLGAVFGIFILGKLLAFSVLFSNFSYVPGCPIHIL